MLRLTPRMALEAPHEYVAFVERHLPRLRRDAALVVGDGHQADELYPDVLTDVAARWGRLELLRTRLGRTGAADVYVRRAFARRARRWQDEQITPIEVEVWQVEQLPVEQLPVGRPPGWQPEQLAPVHARTGQPAPVRPAWHHGGPEGRSSLGRAGGHQPKNSWALRLAPVLLANARIEARPLAEAAIAWWHAYEAARRRRYVLAAAAFLLVLGLLTRLHIRDSDIWPASSGMSAPAAVSAPAGVSAPASCAATAPCR